MFKLIWMIELQEQIGVSTADNFIKITNWWANNKIKQFINLVVKWFS